MPKYRLQFFTQSIIIESINVNYHKIRDLIIMKRCEITNKGKQYGNNVSFSLRRTRRSWSPNLQTKTIIVDGKKVRLKISTSAIRTLKKKGLITTSKSVAKV